MTTHFNQLTEQETELLAILAEECAEVIQIIGKILRHGLNSYDPTTPLVPFITNRDLLEKELGHIKHVQTLLTLKLVLDQSSINKSCCAKAKSIKKYLHHN